MGHLFWSGWEAGLKKVVIESDAAAVVSMVSNGDHSNHPLWDTISGCRELMSKDWSCSVVYAPREANWAADTLAKMGVAQQFEFKFLKDPPECVKNIIRKDGFSHSSPSVVPLPFQSF